MRAADIRERIKERPFEPLSIGMTDGRSVLVYHPDQVVVSDRYVIVGLAKLGRSLPLASPKSGDTIAKDTIMINLLHITTIEPLATGGNGNGAGSEKKSKKKSKKK